MEFAVSVKCAALFFKQRLGKTWIALGTIERIEPRLSLLIVPLTNKESTWILLIRKLLPSYCIYTDFDLFKADAKAGKTRLIFLTHYEEMIKLIKKLKKVKWNFICIDEAHRLKDRNSKWSRAAGRLWDCEYKLILTGTPIERKPQDCWAQFRFLVPEIFGTIWRDFEDRFLEPNPIQLGEIAKKYGRRSIAWRKAIIKHGILNKKREFRWDRLQGFVDLIKPHAWREELPGPKARIIREYVGLHGEQKRVYEEMRKHQVVRLKDGTRVMAGLEITKRAKLHQIAGGFVYDEDREVHRFGNAKLFRTLAIVKREGKPFVIVCHYTPELEQLLHAVPGKLGFISGKNRRERAEVVRRFQAGELDGVICQQRAGGIGIDLYKAKYMIVFSATHSFIDWDQVIARIQLPDQKEPVRIFLVLARGTLDEEKHRMIGKKSHETENVLSQLKRS